MFYLVQAMEDYTNAVLPSFTKLFSSKAAATAYAKLIVANKCGFDFAEITQLDLDGNDYEFYVKVAACDVDPLAELTPEEYERATTPV